MMKTIKGYFGKYCRISIVQGEEDHQYRFVVYTKDSVDSEECNIKHTESTWFEHVEDCVTVGIKYMRNYDRWEATY